jgi:hypothetical protein
MRRIGTVTATRLNVRPTPATTRPPTATLARGARVTVLERDAGWYRIEVGARRGWVAAQYVSLQPLLLVDLYWATLGDRPPWDRLAAAPGYAGAILKATEGIVYARASWFVDNWQRLRAAGGARYGASWFRGAYHFLIFGRDGSRQADHYLDTVDRAGGWDRGDLLPIVDVERVGESHPNYRATRQEVIDVVSAWVARVKSRTGREVMLYGRGAMRDLRIESRMGAARLWNPGYTRSMPATTSVGWPAELVPLWQYTDGRTNLTSYPATVPGFGAVDASAFLGGDVADLAAQLVRPAPARRVG